ncbi:MAG: protein-L-isoaspartate(D-aspartate) O-methyltransferase [Gammaproteobacteria bacterium]|jgi:protein-L-isoaspartate(D-aspartate) O-methyltransferase
MTKSIKHMIADIEREVEYTRSLTGRKALDPRVMRAMSGVPRDAFVSSDLKACAFDNGPLPIGHGQTISQPYIVALMTDLLRLEKEHRVLEIGTGCGYQTAVLAELAGRVFTVELVRELGEAAQQRLKGLGYTNIEFRIGNGYQGWQAHAPYDAIIVTAAAAHIPHPLVDQLAEGGRLVIPVGLPYMDQQLRLVEKDAQGNCHTRDILGVAFVPLRETGQQGAALNGAADDPPASPG